MRFSESVKLGFLEDYIIKSTGIKPEGLEPKAKNCTQVLDEAFVSVGEVYSLLDVDFHCLLVVDPSLAHEDQESGYRRREEAQCYLSF